MAAPAKRKRNIVLDQEDEQDERPTPTKKKNLNDYFSSPDAKDKAIRNDALTSDPPNPARRNTRSAQAALAKKTPTVSTRSRPSHSSSTKSPTPSPIKSKKSLDEKGKFANIRTLFSNQSQKIKADPKSFGRSKKLDLQTLDISADPLSDDEEISLHRASDSSLVGRKAQKRSGDVFESGPTWTNGTTAVGQKFLRPSHNNSGPMAELGDQRPWSERFGPVHLDELVVHKRKVADVRRWLQDVLSGRMRQRLLILKGAAGTGKTTTIQLLAKDMGFEILEWRNPGGTLGSTQGSQSTSAQFEEFLGRGRKFGQLDFDAEDISQVANQVEGLALRRSYNDRQRVILIEEFPNTFMKSGSALTSFRRTLLQFLANNTPSLNAFGQNDAADSVIPVIIVVSETLLTTTSASADSFTAHRLLGPEILRHPGTAVIEFRAVAPTLLAKSLELVVKKEARVSGRRRTPGPQVLKHLGEIGDIRSAISSLEFLCLRGDDADWGSKVAFTRTKTVSKDQALTPGEKQSLQLISHREASLGIFHAVGKVVYNKRDEMPFPEGSNEATAEELPSYLGHLSRKRRSEVSVDTLIDETGTDISTFISALHENYALSCERTELTDPNSSLDYINHCIEYLSEGDLLNPSRDSFFGGKGFIQNGRDQGSHILRQDEMAFEVAVRGLLFSLPCPVKRKSNSSGKGGDAHKMYFPMSGKLWKDREELEGIVDLWASKMLRGDGSASTQQAKESSMSGASLFRKNKIGNVNVGDWPGNRTEMKDATRAQPTETAQTSLEEAAPLVALGSTARQEMVLERLPYMAQMMRRQRAPMFSLGLRDIEKVVSFQGIGAPVDEETDESIEDEEAIGTGVEAWATDKPTDGATPRKRRTTTIRTRSEQSEGSMISSAQMHNLVLSDDDIEDDSDD